MLSSVTYALYLNIYKYLNHLLKRLSGIGIEDTELSKFIHESLMSLASALDLTLFIKQPIMKLYTIIPY